MRAVVVLLAAGLTACSSFRADTGASDAGAAEARVKQGGQLACPEADGGVCAVGSEACCLDFGGQNSCVATPTVTGLGTLCGGESTRVAACDDTSQCADGLVCCVEFANPPFFSSACVAPAECATADHRELCYPRGSTCSSGKACTTEPKLMGLSYGVCP